MSLYVCSVGGPQHHHNAQSLGFALVCSGCCDTDRQLSPVLLEAVCLPVYVCVCMSRKQATVHHWWLTSEDRCLYILK